MSTIDRYRRGVGVMLLNSERKVWVGAAHDLRAEPQLIKELRWHRASVASFVFIVGMSRRSVQRALDRIDFDARASR